MKPILIVDDEAIVRDSIGDWLRNAGYQVETAETGEIALEMVEKREYSILILDVRLPGKSGIQVLKEVKASKPHIKSIIITAFPSQGVADEAMRLGAVDFLIKPVLCENLERLILETLAKCENETRV
ncbi:MAG: response regulator [Dehalococcoidia bacterium]|nr:response regulator [Dehalococcoidia bacterium]MDD5494864.1 response regulator [Dehalococcoidia bacterium]